MSYKRYFEERYRREGPAYRERLARSVTAGGLYSDEQIAHLINIQPLAKDSPPGVISYGLSSYGYDLRVDRKFKVFTPGPYNVVVDPKNIDVRAFVDYEGDVCIIPPNSFALAISVEEFWIPRGALAICLGKSSYARCGIIVPMTPLEPEWKGKVTLEISNTTPLPAMVYAGEGLAQVIFLQGMQNCAISYEDKKGKYQRQTDITLPFVTKV